LFYQIIPMSQIGEIIRKNKQREYEGIQFEIEHIYTDSADQLQQRLDDFTFLHDDCHHLSSKFKIEFAYEWYRRVSYQKKAQDLKRLYRKWEDDLWLFTYNEKTGLIVYKKDEVRLTQLQTLISYAELLSENWDSSNETKFLRLEVEFLATLSKEDRGVLNSSGIKKDPDGSFSNIYKKFLQSYLSRLVKALILCRRDLRQFLRNIIRLHFKAMNDEIEAEYLFLNPSLRRDLFTSKFHFHEHKSCHFTAAAYT
jgi:hypothetical protein